jgi:hypothetical protein
MSPADAADATAGAVAVLTQAIRTASGPDAVSRLAQGLSALAARLGPREAARAAAVLGEAIREAQDPRALPALEQGLSAVADRMDRKEAEGALLAVARLPAGPRALALARGLAGSAANDPLTALPRQGPTLFSRGQDGPAPSPGPNEADRSTALVREMAGGADQARLGLLARDLAVLLSPSSVPELVELLKSPGYVGAARRVVLDQLGQRSGRRFADLWEFVAWAQEQEPGLDLTTPPQRPGP